MNPRRKLLRFKVHDYPLSLRAESSRLIGGGIGEGSGSETNTGIGSIVDEVETLQPGQTDRKSTRLNSSHSGESRMPSSA